MSGQTPGQGDDGGGSTHSGPSQQLDTSLVKEIDTQEADEGSPDQEPTETVERSDDDRPAVHDDGEDAAEENEQNDDNNNDPDEIPERPSSRLDYASDEEGNPIIFQQPPPRYSQSPGLSHISELSNETTRSANPPQDADTQPATDREIKDNSPDHSESDSEQNEETLAEVANARSQLFERLFTRLRDENLYTNPDALIRAEADGTMPGAYVRSWWNAQDLQTRSSGYINELSQFNTRPRGDGTVLSARVQNQIREQLQGMASLFHNETMRWFRRGLRSDTDYMLQITNSIDDLLANRPRTAPTSRAQSTASSGPERVEPILDRHRLRRLEPDVLINMILQQDSDRRVAADQFEANIESAIAQADAQRDEAVTQRDKAQADLEKVVDGTQKLREIAHQNGLNNQDMDGKPLRKRQTPADATGTRSLSDLSNYAHEIEDQLYECKNNREKDKKTIQNLRFENADMKETLQTAWKEAPQAREGADMARHTGPNAEDTGTGDPISRQEISSAPSSEVPASGQGAAPSPTSEESNDAADREPLRDTDAELEELRIEHRLELAQLRADYAKEISDLRSEIDDDRRRAQGNPQEDPSAVSEPSQSQEGSRGSVRSQTDERRESSGRRSARSGAPRLDDLLEALWADDDETAAFMAIGDSWWQGEQRGQVESDPTSQRPSISPTQTGSESGSNGRPDSSTAASRLAELEKENQELTTANGILRRRLNSTEQMREGAVARTRHLEVVRNGLQENLAKKIHHEDALQKQISDLRQVRTDLQHALEESEGTQEQLVTQLERARNTLQLHLASSQTTRNTEQDNAETAAPATDALQQRVQDLEAANKILRGELVAAQAANSDLQQRFTDVDQERTNLQKAVDNDFVTYQELQNGNKNLELQNTSLNQNIRRTTRERDDAREELVTVRFNLEDAEYALQEAEAERDQAIFDLLETESLLEEQAADLMEAENEARLASSEELASQKLLAAVRRQLRECREHKAAQSSTPVPDHPQQDANIVNRLVQTMNRIRQFTPHANEIAQFATILVRTGRRDPGEWAAELRQVTDLAGVVRWPDEAFNITPARREDPGLLDAELNPWLSTIEAAIDDSVRLSAAVGSLRVSIDIWNALNPREQDGSHGGLSTRPGSERGNSQAGHTSSRHSIASATDSFTTQERGELLNAAAEAVNQYMREHPDSPVDEARRLMITGAAADLFLSKLMGERRSENGEGETESRVTSENDVESSSAGGSGRPDRMRPNYIDPAWLRAHRNGPCKDCVPVQRFPVALFPGGVDPGPCRCGPSDMISIHSAESRSSRISGLRSSGINSLGALSSRTRSVAFSDDQGAENQDASGGGASTKAPRGILKRPESINTAKAKTGSSRGPLRSPYPTRVRSLPSWNAAKLPFPRQTKRPQSARAFKSDRGMSLPTKQLSHDYAVPIMPVQKHCCAHYFNRRRVCGCDGKCVDHRCCEHWDPRGVCECKGTCHVPCCEHWEKDTKHCTCEDSCATHASKKCCICGFKPGVVPKVCACDNTCRDHAVCKHFLSYKPEELSCMAECDAFKKDGKCEHGDVCQKTPCDVHPCCTHHVSEESRAYCGCGKTCRTHVCCSHWLADFKTCECRGTCQDHLPVVPELLLQHFRDVAAVAEAQTTPPDLASELYHPAGRMFPRQDGQPYDWHQVVQANMDLLRSRGLAGPNGQILAAAGDKRAPRTRSHESQHALAALTTLTAPPAPPGAFQASLRGGSGVPERSRGVRRRFGLRNDALADMPDLDAQRLLSDSLLDFPGPLPDFGNIEDADSTRLTRASPRRAAGAGAGHAGCGCKCRCQGNASHELTGPGGRFSYYTCRRMRSGGDDGENEDGDMDSTRATDASLNSFSTASSSFHSQPSRDEIYSRHSSLQNSAAAGSQGGSRVVSQHSSQGVPSRLGSRAASRHSSLQNSQGAGSQAGSRQSSHSTASQLEFSQGSRRSSARSGTDSADNPGPDDQEPEIENHGGGAGGEPGQPGEPGEPGEPGGPGGPGENERPLRPLRPDRRPPPNPWRQIWNFAWFIIRFLTYGQATNLQAILSFAYDFALLNIQQALHYLHLAQLWQRLPKPRFPHAETISFMVWSLLVWQLTTMIALGEERRLWLAANPRTAAYVRGLQFREPYSRWSLFQVNYALLRPALGGFSVWLHRLYFRPGMFGSLRNACRSLQRLLNYSRIEEALVHVKDMVFDAVLAVVMLPVVIVTAVWTFIVSLVPSWLDVSSVRPGNTGGAVNWETPVTPAHGHPPSVSDPQVVHGGAAWWEVFWEYFKDLVVRTVLGRRKVSQG